MMAKQSGSGPNLCVCFDWFLSCVERHLIPVCLYGSTLAGINPLQTGALLVAVYLPLVACACLGAVYLPAVVFLLLALYCKSLHREAASGTKDDQYPDCESNACSPGHLKDRTTRIKHAAELLCTQKGSEFKSKQHMQDEEHKAQAKVFALGAKDQTLRKQAVQCTEGASKRQELEADQRTRPHSQRQSLTEQLWRQNC
ncbi:hypothetical protein ABBQ32_010528 [Trebouxia sp. C0010 RCD-2024]